MNSKLSSSIVSLLSLTLLVVFLTACDPLAPVPTITPQIIIVTPEHTATPIETPTPLPTATDAPTSTPEATATATPFPCEAEGGQVFDFDDFESEVAGEDLPYRVYVPPCYLETQKRYPVVYLFHGLTYNEDQWEDIGIIEALDQGIRLRAAAPMILVMPDFGSIGIDNTYPPDPSFETYVLEELMPAVQRDFCTWNERTYRGIGGISRGGFWAFSIGLRHPDIFGKLGGHSATFTTNNAPSANNPLELALNASFLQEANLSMYLDNAASDPAGGNLELFSSRLSSRGIQHTYIINPTGDHNNDYWASHITEYLSFYGSGWPRETNQLPSCLEPSP